MEVVLGDEQAGFSLGRSTIDQLPVFTIKQIVEKYTETNNTLLCWLQTGFWFSVAWLAVESNEKFQN